MEKLNILQHKVKTLPELLRQVNIWRLEGKKIVFTNGCFDILHKGHVTLLAQAAEQGNVLIVGLNSDASVKRLKGPERPINDAAARALVLASQLFIDAVVLFEEDTPAKLIKAIRPDVLVKGGDYSADQVVGADTVLQNGGKVSIIPLLDGFSTTHLIKQMQTPPSSC